ncbi:MAG: hypothetical protein DSZ27_02090 [Thiomicrospira sp.]|nr:MAG: hypothetical protein DSZ27_02090 [Thiomicrospira sp.]
MKNRSLIALLVSAGVLSACSSTEVKEEKTPNYSGVSCVFPNSKEAAPGWVCDEPVPGLVLSAVGIAEPSQAGISYMKDMAAADGRGRLAEQMQVQVQKMVKQYLGTTGKGDRETVDAAASTTLKTVTNEALVGSKVHGMRFGPNGKLYALVGIDEAAKSNIVKTAVSTSMRNNEALWQQFKSKQSFDEMSEAIAKQPIQ